MTKLLGLFVLYDKCQENQSRRKAVKGHTLKVEKIFARLIFEKTYFREFRKLEKNSQNSQKFVFPKFSKTLKFAKFITDIHLYGK